MEEKQIKTRQRVTERGEVFTAEREVTAEESLNHRQNIVLSSTPYKV